MTTNDEDEQSYQGISSRFLLLLSSSPTDHHLFFPSLALEWRIRKRLPLLLCASAFFRRKEHFAVITFGLPMEEKNNIRGKKGQGGGYNIILENNI